MAKAIINEYQVIFIWAYRRRYKGILYHEKDDLFNRHRLHIYNFL